MNTENPRDRKNSIRQKALADRQAQLNKDAVSNQILGLATTRPEYQQARTVLFYVHRRDEVRTQPALESALTTGKRICVPYCVGDRLELFHLEFLDELEAATFGILEPRLGVRSLPEKRLDPQELDLVFVPGVAFDPRGTRIGYGRGYFDRLLANVRDDAALIALAFQCQMVAAIPACEHDVPVNQIITERQIYDCGG